MSQFPIRKAGGLKGILLTLGPGLIFAGASIGVSHIVQSTRAGADYGFALFWFVVLSMVVKFPFFEFGPRYVCATGDNLLVGYRNLGKWAVNLFIIQTIGTMFIIQSAVTLVTAGLFSNLIGNGLPMVWVSIGILLVCVFLLDLGKYPVLDKLIKAMLVVLGICTMAAFILALMKGSQAPAGFKHDFTWDLAGFSFLLALMGWMPSPIDVSVWHSIWSTQRIEQTKHHPNIKECLFDFHFGYWGTLFMALLFLGLGALVMFGTAETFSDSAVKFTAQVIALFTNTIGPWSFWIIATAAAITMFSTTITCLDAYASIVKEASVMLWPQTQKHADTIFKVAVLALSVVTVIVIGKFLNRMTLLIDVATTISFLIAPVLAYMNLRVVTSENFPQDKRPSDNMVTYSWLCIIFLSLFSLAFLVWRFIWSV